MSNNKNKQNINNVRSVPKHANAKGNQRAYKKMEPNNNQPRMAIIHSIFKARDQETGRVFNILVAQSYENQHPWKYLNLGDQVDKEYIRNLLKNKEIYG